MSPELHISFANLQSNLQFFRKVIKKNTELSAVVKSDAYGLGITKIVPEIEKYGVKSFFTATIVEAIEVRKCSLRSEIFTLNGFDFPNNFPENGLDFPNDFPESGLDAGP